jgi:hypothetical protein
VSSQSSALASRACPVIYGAWNRPYDELRRGYAYSSHGAAIQLTAGRLPILPVLISVARFKSNGQESPMLVLLLLLQKSPSSFL